MSDIFIDRCTLRLVRRGGWNWGSDPARMVRQIMRLLPELIAKKLSGLGRDEEHREFSAPVRVSIRIRLSDLSSALGSETVFSGAEEAPIEKLLGERVESALRAATGSSNQPTPLGQERRALPLAPEPDGDQMRGSSHPTGAALMHMLVCWHRNNALERRLSVLTAAILESWCEHLRRMAEQHASLPENISLSSELESFVAARAAPDASRSRAGAVRCRLMIAVESACHFSSPLAVFMLWPILDRMLPIEAEYAVEEAPSQAASRANPLRPQRSLERAPATTHPNAPFAVSNPFISSRSSLFEWEVKIDSALPFLLLNPLSRLGYFIALDGILEAAQLTGEASLFAAALAFKVLDPPERSWLRSAASMLSASVFAGHPEGIREDSLVEFARRITGHTQPLDLVMTDAIATNHTAGEPVTLIAADSDSATWLLVDSQGCLPIAWISSSTEQKNVLLEHLRDVGRPLVLVALAAAVNGILGDLDQAGIPFLTDAAPTRGELWDRAKFGGGPFGWTNAKNLVPAELLHRALNEMRQAFEEAQGLAEKLQSRPAAPLAASLHLDRSVALAASSAMGTIAWMLWKDRGRTSPAQILERYADFDARVRADGNLLRVALPLGRRYLELRDAGLLAPVRDIPWLPGRSVEFTGG